MDDRQIDYVRGAGGVLLPPRRVLAVALALIAIGLAVLVAVVAAEDLQRTAHQRALARSGITVEVRVTGCVANASGTGITQSGFTCRGHYQLAGQVYNQVIHGSSRQFPAGADTRGITSPARPNELFAPAAVRKGGSYRSALTVPLVLAGLLLGTLACEYALLRGVPRRGFLLSKPHVGPTRTSASLH